MIDLTLENAASNPPPASTLPEPQPPVPAVSPADIIPPVAKIEVPVRDVWVLLDDWCQSNGFSPPRLMTTGPQPVYSFASSTGVMSVKIGSQVALWNGMEYRLGFPPLIFAGRPYLHSLDLRKNFSALTGTFLAPDTNRVIVLDPGHGGSDSGTSNVYTGHFEKEYTLDLARRLQALLLARGWTALLTRSNDSTVHLADRVAFAEQHHASLFVSLHFNSAFPDRQQSGLETYCLTPSGMPSSLTRGFSDNPSLVYPNNRYDDWNLQLAVTLHRALLNVNGHDDRGVRRARFLTVLQGENRPAVLIEGGYLSNPREARQIADPDYRERMAEALAEALTGSEALRRTSIASQVPPMAPMTNADGKMN